MSLIREGKKGLKKHLNGLFVVKWEEGRKD